MGASAIDRDKKTTPRDNRTATHPPLVRSDGVDLTLIRWMVRLTPTERLAVLQDHVNLVTGRRRAATAD